MTCLQKSWAVWMFVAADGCNANRIRISHKCSISGWRLVLLRLSATLQFHLRPVACTRKHPPSSQHVCLNIDLRIKEKVTPYGWLQDAVQKTFKLSGCFLSLHRLYPPRNPWFHPHFISVGLKPSRAWCTKLHAWVEMCCRVHQPLAKKSIPLRNVHGVRVPSYWPNAITDLRDVVVSVSTPLLMHFW